MTLATSLVMEAEQSVETREDTLSMVFYKSSIAFYVTFIHCPVSLDGDDADAANQALLGIMVLVDFLLGGLSR